MEKTLEEVTFDMDEFTRWQRRAGIPEERVTQRKRERNGLLLGGENLGG